MKKRIHWSTLALIGCLFATNASMASDLKLWYREPGIETITEGLPIGNGRIGALIMGGVDTERLTLNEGTLWAGGPYNADNPAAKAALPEVRRHLFQGKYAEAQALAQSDLMGKPMSQMPYQPLANLEISFPDHQRATDYRRELDLEQALARVTYSVDGVRYTREYFASAADNVLVMRLKADRAGALNAVFHLTSPQKDSDSSANSLGIGLYGRNGEASGIPGALRFSANLRVIPDGGMVRSGQQVFMVKGANSITVIFDGATSYKSWKDVSGNPAAQVAKRIQAAEKLGFDALLLRHASDFHPRFERMNLNLGQDADAANLPTDERVARNLSHKDPALAALYVQYARYLLLSSSRPGGQPANLQGLWNDRLSPPWGSKYTININTEMNYWPADPAGLPECVDPLVRFAEDLSESGQRSASAMYGARGWVAHHNTDLWRATSPVDGAFWGLWPMGGAWLCTNLWDHYEFRLDAAYLQRIYPVLKGSAQFFLDTLVEDPQHKTLVTAPSISPENAHHPDVSICAGPTMDNAILRDLFDHVATASRLLGIDADFRAQVLAARQRLAPFKIGKAGQLQEWQDDWDAGAPEQDHRHVSHLYALHPSHQIDPRHTPDLAAAARKTLEQRTDLGTGWSLAWKINFWSRLRDGNRAYTLLQNLLAPERTYTNLFDAHPPFQIDGNFGGASGVLEMLAQSRMDWDGLRPKVEVDLLPALPDAWKSGQVNGLNLRGGLSVDLAWKEGRVSAAKLKAASAIQAEIHWNGQSRVCSLKAGEQLDLK
ncbi:MAG TPA: glycoside hydrolase family 95 protein [Holophaga sp.]|nr:glycoside hydrolase family 95 protein [Holophaga sp.]